MASLTSNEITDFERFGTTVYSPKKNAAERLLTRKVIDEMTWYTGFHPAWQGLSRKAKYGFLDEAKTLFVTYDCADGCDCQNGCDDHHKEDIGDECPWIWAVYDETDEYGRMLEFCDLKGLDC